MSEFSVLPQLINVTVVRATDNIFEVTYQDDAGNAIDISNDETRWFVKDKPGGATQVEKSVAAGAHHDGPNGVDRFDFTAMDLALAEEETDVVLNWSYSIRRKTAAGDQYDHFRGAFKIVPTSADSF